MFRWLLLLCVLVAVVLGLLVGVLNPNIVSFDLFFFQYELPLGALMLVCFFAGSAVAILIGAVFSLGRIAKRSSD